MSERFSIRIAARAERDLQRLPEKIATASVGFIFGPLAENPRRVSRPLRGELSGFYSARRGDYRVVFGIVDASRAVEIVHIGRRSDVYR